ncbi:MAG: uroporphyrinogen decarboxylase family protein [Deltaproteobacteria bacterium]|nr:uroporphyrinogen decarboxylase family protein [Deltaproteobacteria bacterium]
MNIPTDRMSPKERVSGFLAGGRTDRVPVAPLLLNLPARVLGVPVKRLYESGETLGRAHVAAYRKFGQDFITILTCTANVSEAMGTKLRYPEDDAAMVEEPGLRTLEAVDDLSPVDPAKDGRLPHYLEATEIAVREVGGEVFVITLPAGPFTVAAQLRGVESFFKETVTAPERIHRLLDVCTESILRFVDAIIDRGGVPCLAEPVGSGSLCGKKTFREFNQPYLKRIFDRVRSRGLPALVHICGKAKPIFEPWVEAGPDLCSIDWPTDLEWASRTFGDRVALLGNVASADYFLQGSVGQIFEQARICIEKAGRTRRGFVLGSGCEVPLNSPHENVQALVDAARLHGQDWPPLD